MSTATDAVNGKAYTNGMSQPRARMPVSPQTSRSLSDTSDANSLKPPSVASGQVTPIPPDDAPPSVKATSAARREIRRKTKGRIFPTVEYEDRVSYFDPRSNYSNFRGFFVLFWIGLAIMVITTMLRNLRESGNVLNFRQWPLFRQNMEELAISDGIMSFSTAVSLPLHLLFKRSNGWLRWDKGGLWIQSLYQAAWLALWISWPFVRSWTWTAQVFFTLHTLTMLMKMHSYAFYNGHLSFTLWRLKQLDFPIGPTTPTVSAARYPSAHSFFPLPSQETDEDSNDHVPKPPIVQLRDDLAQELTSPLGNVTYPQNLTVGNFVDYIFCPTLCYELEYPRNPKRAWFELFIKILAVFGCVFLMTVTSEEFIIPVLDEARLRLVHTRTFIDSALVFAETVSRLLFPFMVIFLLVFLSIFEYVLGAFAEITRFADRRFYSDWWNSLDWFEFSREWNIPVHNFFLRHVYLASRGVKLSRPIATAITFLISALAHELIMGCITRKFRGYGFILMMLQMPFVAIQRMPWVRDQQLLNNVMFWICMIFGLSLLCALYVLV